jgi:hypothetical protein
LAVGGKEKEKSQKIYVVSSSRAIKRKTARFAMAHGGIGITN